MFYVDSSSKHVLQSTILFSKTYPISNLLMTACNKTVYKLTKLFEYIIHFYRTIYKTKLKFYNHVFPVSMMSHKNVSKIYFFLFLKSVFLDFYKMSNNVSASIIKKKYLQCMQIALNVVEQNEKNYVHVMYIDTCTRFACILGAFSYFFSTFHLKTFFIAL